MGQRQSTDNAQNSSDEEATWWCRLLGRIIGTLGGLICLFFSIWTMLSVKPRCIASGILEIGVGIIVLIFEAPICFTFAECTQPIARFAEKRSFLQKGILYVVIAIIPFALCAGLSTLFGCGMVFAAGVFYGLMALGRKADRDQMRQNAMEQGGASSYKEGSEFDLVPNEVPPATGK